MTRWLPLIDVEKVVAVSPQLVAALDARPEAVREASVPPYTVYRLADPGPGGGLEIGLGASRAGQVKDQETGGFRSKRRYWIASAMLALVIFSAPSMSAIVLAILRMR